VIAGRMVMQWQMASSELLLVVGLYIGKMLQLEKISMSFCPE
jgi:hypothetical protein